MRDLLKAIRLGPAGWADLARAVFELALANRRLNGRSMSELLGPNAPESLPAGSTGLSAAQLGTIARVAFAVPRMGSRVPWRSDCLIQALAARRWLAGQGIASELCIGVRAPREPEFAAHAWLRAGETIVTGGDIGGYAPLLATENEVLALFPSGR